METAVSPTRLTLSDEEIFEITGYRAPSKQLVFFQRLGVPARRRPDGSVSVGRRHYEEFLRPGRAANDGHPKLKSDKR